jgi:predicted AAA+ superfamily ATPase
MVERTRHVRRLQQLLRHYPVVAVLGARQVGKTTLAHALAARVKGPTMFFDLERRADRARLEDPDLALASLRGLVVLDEIHRAPEIFPVLRVLADRPRLGTRFLVLGSASPDLLRQTSESLAGRIAYHDLPGFSLDEVGVANLSRLWGRGGFPRSFLTSTERQSVDWRRQFIRTFLERDVPQFGIAIPSETLRRFWSMLAHYHGQVWNASEFARAFGVADTTVRRYLDALVATFVVRQLLPWSENLGKRQVKAPKVYIADSGLLHRLLGLDTLKALEGHPKVGASWEGFLLGEVVQRLAAQPDQCWFWRTHAGAELDLLVIRGRERLGFEFKRTVAPALTPSMRSALQDLKLDHLDVIHAGGETFPLGPRVRAVAASRLLEDL